MRDELVVRHLGAARGFVRPAALMIVIAVVFTPSAALAQRPQFGAKAGPSFTGIVLPEDTGQDFHSRIAAAVGAFFVLPVHPRLGLQFEAMSSPKGTRLKDGSDVTQTLLLHYFELPVLVRVAGPKHGGAATYFIGGPFFGIRVSAKEQFSTLAGTVISGARIEVPDSVQRFESGLIAGAGMDIGKYMLVEGRYSRGLTNVNNVEGRTKFTNHGFSFTTGVRF
jgi:hypothetical protein